MRLIKQNDTTKPLVFLMVDSSDHISGKTGLSPTVTLSKNGGSFASPSGSVQEIGYGWYKLNPASADVGTLGPLLLHATASGADPTDVEFQVIAVDVYDGNALGLSRLDAAVSTRLSSTDSRLNNLDATISSRLASSDARLDYLDTPISTRASAEDAGAIRNQTDKLTFDGDYIQAKVYAYNTSQSPAEQILVTTSNKISVDASNQVKAKVFAYDTNQSPAEQVLVNTAQKVHGQNTQNLQFDGGNVKAKVYAYDAGMAPPTTTQIWTHSARSLTDKSDFSLSSASIDAVANQVWDEPIGEHTGDGTTGKALANAASGNVDYDLLADAVWDELLSGHQTEGSTGKALSQAAQGGGESTVLIQPLSARVQTPVGDGGTVTFWTAATMRASWMVSEDLSEHELVFLMYVESNPESAIVECKGDEITITPQTYGSLIELEASETKLPEPGEYRYVIRDQTVDSVLLVGECFVYEAPDVTP